jgi:hypothetical protein
LAKANASNRFTIIPVKLTGIAEFGSAPQYFTNAILLGAPFKLAAF